MPTSTMTSKGQTTIPLEVREFLKLKAGDRLEFIVGGDDGTVTLKAANVDVLRLRGLLKRPGMTPYNPNERAIAHKQRARQR